MSNSDAATPRGIVWDEVPDACPQCGGAVIVDEQAAMYCENSFIEFDGECGWEPLEAPMQCPECQDERVFGDGCEFECEFCGFTWGSPSGRGDVHPERSMEPEVSEIE